MGSRVRINAEGTRTCKRCKKSEERWLPHEWDNGGRCSRCGDTQDHFRHIKKAASRSVEDHFSGCKLMAVVDLRATPSVLSRRSSKNAAASSYLADRPW